MSIGTKGEAALKLLIQLNELGIEDYQKILKEKVGEEVLTVFESYCREIVPEDKNQEEVLGTLVHLMITGFLVSSNEQNPIFEPLIQLTP